MSTSPRRLSTVEQLRERRRAMGDGTLKGKARVATPVSHKTGGLAAFEGSAPDPTTPDGAGNFPATLTVEAFDVPVDGEPIMFTDVVDEAVQRQQLVPWEGPADEVTWPAGGTIQVYVEGVLDSPVASGLVEVLLDDAVVWSSATPGGA
jgi:hypothetical protein